MKQTAQYVGLDYGMGHSNVDKETGIRYGVISQRSVMPEALDDIMTHGEDVAWSQAVAELELEHGKETEALEEALEQLGNNWETDFGNMSYIKDGYKLTGCLNNDLFVIKSPYFTYAQFCSPCVPGAGNLDHPCDGGVKCYCLGNDWFESGAPYPIYSVETGLPC